MNIKSPHWLLGRSQNWASSSSWAESYEEPVVCVYLVILSNYSYIWSKVKIPLIAINEGHIDQILTSTDSPLTCPFRRRGEQEREGERSVWRINMMSLNPFSGIFATWLHTPWAQQSSAMQKILQPASIFLQDRAHWLHCVSHKTGEFSKQWNSLQRIFSEPSLYY